MEDEDGVVSNEAKRMGGRYTLNSSGIAQGSTNKVPEELAIEQPKEACPHSVCRATGKGQR